MKKILLFLCLVSFATAPAVQAGQLNVATDILPVQSLVARVMDGVGTPDLVFPPNAAPHRASLRPSQAAILAQADIVFWVGGALSPALARSIDSLASGAVRVSLMEVPGTRLLQRRTSVRFDQSRDTPAQSVLSADPHAWLDPENAKRWVVEIAAILSQADPDNATLYQNNAAQAQEELAELINQTNARLSAVRGGKFIVYHDAYHYFEARFNLQATGAVALSDGSAPGPARVTELRDIFQQAQATCLFLEPQFEPRLLDTLVEGTKTRTVILDPIGVALEPGKMLYPALIRGLVDSVVSCLR